MEELNKIKKSNIRIIIAIILVILSSIQIIITYHNYLEEERERIRNSNNYSIRTEVEYFNSKFAWAAGNNITAAKVKDLCKIVIMNNATDEDITRQVFIKEGDISQLHTREQWQNSGAYYTAEDIAKLRDRILSTDKYKVEMCSEHTTGLVLGIGITKIEM